MTTKNLTIFGCILSLFLYDCGSNSSDGNSGEVNKNSIVMQMIKFSDLDAYLQTNKIASSSLSGIWMIYETGEYYGPHLTGYSPFELIATVVSVYVIDDGTGGYKVILRNCTGNHPDNSSNLKANIDNVPIYDFVTNLTDLRQLIPTYSPFNIYSFGDPTEYTNFLNQDVHVTVYDNNTMYFPADISYVDTNGYGFRISFKGVKLSNDYYIDVGQLKVDKQSTVPLSCLAMGATYYDNQYYFEKKFIGNGFNDSGTGYSFVYNTKSTTPKGTSQIPDPENNWEEIDYSDGTNYWYFNTNYSYDSLDTSATFSFKDGLKLNFSGNRDYGTSKYRHSGNVALYIPTP